MYPLRIGVNALYLLPGQVGGTEIYLRQLLLALARIDHINHYYVFTNQETAADVVPVSPQFSWRPQTVKATSRPARLLYEQFTLPKMIDAERIDVLLNPGYTAPLRSSAPAVTVFHDLQHVKHPEYFKKLDLPFWRLMLAASVKRSRRLIAVSETTRRSVLEHYRLEPERVVTVEHGVERELFDLARCVDEKSPYLLCVSTLHPHKNIERLLRVFVRLKQTRFDLRLVLVGMRGFHTTQVEQTIRDLALTDAVTVTGWIPRQQLYALYAGATAFVYPSTFEGFGMPVLEAMAARVPVACSNISPIQEIAAGTTQLFDPLNEPEMFHAVESALGQGSELVERAYRRAQHFSWEEAARKTLQVLESVSAEKAAIPLVRAPH